MENYASIKNPNDLQLLANHLGFCVCMTTFCYDAADKKEFIQQGGVIYGQISKIVVLPVLPFWRIDLASDAKHCILQKEFHASKLRKCRIKPAESRRSLFGL